MSLKSRIYQSLPDGVRPPVRNGYCDVLGALLPAEVRLSLQRWSMLEQQTEDAIHEGFVSEIFDSRSEYATYVTEFEDSSFHDLSIDTLQKFQSMSLDIYRDYYAIIRSLDPDLIIETGVCVGFSTYAILMALKQNGNGRLHSIDYPFYADESLDEFRKETFDGYGGAAIPRDKEPGWIIPDELRDNWELTIGKSQRKLPEVIADEGVFDVFLHDSEHSHPCMMFEYEIANEWLSDGGYIISDDISWNQAFSTFVDVRNLDWGRISNNIGYAVV